MRDEGQLPVTVYSKPNCVQCSATYRFLESHGIPFQVVDLEEDQAAMDMVVGLGYAAAPVVIVPEGYPSAGWHWSGFRPDLLGSLIV